MEMAQGQSNENNKLPIRKVFERRESKEYTDLKVKFAQNKDSIVIPTYSRETRLLIQLTLVYDKTVNLARVRAGTYMPLPEVADIIQEASELLTTMQQLNRQIGARPVGYEADEVKERIARKNTSYVVWPRTPEAKDLFIAIKEFDNQFVVYKTQVRDFLTQKEVFTQIREIAEQLHSFNVKMTARFHMEYKQPALLRKMVSSDSSPASPEGDLSH